MSGTATNKERYRNYMEAFARPAGDGWFTCVKELFSPDSKINIVHPFNEVSGADGLIENFLKPMMASFEGLHRRDYIMMAGEFENGAWVSSTGYFAGHFSRPWLSIQPTHALAYIRVGEFHRFENGRIIESYVYLDIPELMIAAGQWPDIPSPASVKGYTGFLPGPATQDGLRFAEADPALSKSSLSIVTEMLLQLNTENEGWRPYWHENMVWYGPAAFGSFIGIENFAAFQRPFEQCFKTWVGGAAKGSKTRHFVRTADGNYICSGGWPSLNAFQIKPFLGQAATNKDLFMRVCDWWRRDGDHLVENWVFVDIPHVLLQMGYDVFGELNK